MQVKHKLESTNNAEIERRLNGKKKVVMIENEVVSKLRGVEMSEIEKAIKGVRVIKDLWLKSKIAEIKQRRLERLEEHSGKDEK